MIFNLAPRTLPWHRFIVALLSAAVLIFLIHFSAYYYIQKIKKTQQALSTKIIALQPSYQQSLQLSQRLQQINQTHHHWQKLMQLKTSPMPLLSALNNAMINGIYLTNVTVANQQFMIVGKAETKMQIQQFYQKLMQSSQFKMNSEPLIESDNNYLPYRWSFTLKGSL